MKKILVIAALALVAALIVGFKSSRYGVESPQYEVMVEDGPFQIRLYPSLKIVSTPMKDPDPAEGTSFMRLFRYISGDNQAEQKIAMTTPVLTTQGEDGRRMAFIVPREVAQAGVPPAESEGVRIETLDSGRFAVYRFSGGWDQADFREARQKLANWANEEGLQVEGQPIIANYDPPYTPNFLRRNEVLLRLAE